MQIKMVTKEEALRYLSEVAPERCFWVNNGPVLKKLEDLANFLPNMSEETFKHHVSRDKNDFSSWINDIVGDKTLANELLSSKSKDSIAKKIQKRLTILRNKTKIVV